MSTYAKAILSDPSRTFQTPDQVLHDGKLSRDDKVTVLRSMAAYADQIGVAASEGMAGSKPAYNANDLQSALAHLEKLKKYETVDDAGLQTARFQRIMVVTTVNQDLNRAIADVAFDMAEIVSGKVYLLNVVPSALDGVGLAAAGPMVTAVPLVAADDSQIIEDRTEQLAVLRAESGSSVETEIEVRTGQIEQVIVDYADDCGADVVVVGAPNRSWLEALFDPSIARRVTRSAPCPVLVVPETT
jgi:nucleotide-binding universal stress UspA family protein